jgi:hypothetical protein
MVPAICEPLGWPAPQPLIDQGAPDPDRLSSGRTLDSIASTRRGHEAAPRP